MKIGPYTILEKIGEGGMGVIYKAEQCTLQQVVAIKTLALSTSGNDLRERFIQEAALQAKLSHPNVVKILDFLDLEGRYYLVMEYVEGETLDSAIRTRGLLRPDQCIPMFKQILAGAGYAHSMGLIHGDITPSNILIKKDGTIKITSFGMAKFAVDLKQTSTGFKLGNLCYMSPEQVKGHQASVSSDIYSLGVTLFEMLTAQVPFSGKSEYSIMKNIVDCAPPSPRQMYRHVPIPLEDIIMKAMAKEPAERFTSVEEFSAALDRIAQDAGTRATAALRFPLRRRKELVAGAIAVTVAAMLALLLQSGSGRVQSAGSPHTAPVPAPQRVAAPPAAPAPAPQAEVEPPPAAPVPAPQAEVAVPPAAPVPAPQAEVAHPPAVVPPEGTTGAKLKLTDQRREAKEVEQQLDRAAGESSTRAAKAKGEDDGRQRAQLRRYLEEASRLHENGDYSKAINTYQRVLALAPGNEEAKRGLRDSRSARSAEKRLGTLQ